jgi:hypothetical protein
MSALLFHPLPSCRADTSVSESSYASYFGEKAATGKSLSAQTKSGSATPDIFRQYLQLFTTTKVPFRSSWSHPLQGDRFSQSNRPEVEVLGTMYNFLAFSHTQLLAIDGTSQTALVSVRGLLLDDSTRAIRTISDYSQRSDHAGLSREFAAFVTAYQRFVTSLWQFCCGQAANVSDYDMARYLHRVIIELTAAQSALKPIIHPPTFSLYINGTLDYYTALARFHLGKANQSKNEFAYAIACHRSVIGILTRLKTSTPPPNFLKPIEALIQNSMTLKNELDRKIQSTGIHVPMDPPPLPAPANYPASGESHASTSPSVPSPTVRPPPASATMPASAGLAEWEAMMVLKTTLIARADTMLQSPDAKVQTKGKQFKQALAAVNAADADVARTVRAFQAGAPNVSKVAVLEAIAKTQLFYTDLEVRMNVFDTTGR